MFLRKALILLSLLSLPIWHESLSGMQQRKFLIQLPGEQLKFAPLSSVLAKPVIPIKPTLSLQKTFIIPETKIVPIPVIKGYGTTTNTASPLHQLQPFIPQAKTSLTLHQNQCESLKNVQVTPSVKESQKIEVAQQQQQEAQEFNAQLAQQYAQCKTLESKVSFTFKLVAQHNDLVSNGASRKMIDACDTTMHSCITDITNSMRDIFGDQPEFLTNCWAARFLGRTNLEELWKKIINGNRNMRICLGNLAQQKVHSLKDIRDSLQQTSVTLDLALSTIQEMNQFGFDDSGIKPAEYHRIIEGLTTDIKVINSCMIGFDKLGVYSASQFIRTETIPACMTKTCDAKLWDMYTKEVRNFVVEHYRKGMSGQDVMHASTAKTFVSCTEPQNPLDVYESLMRKMVLVSDLEYTLKAKGDHGIDEAYATEHTSASSEVQSFSNNF